ncbi:serine O-acetyltransferase EpsC [Lacticigenium naphthae]|uniref:serine O-acetyltransferase EpsC n=1 Tax=Lacticigenium naphthae TaxID=515351 RepID=UPI000406FAFE|nr:serine O-acetyltransferase EpsC [Lacticigenium naphthae]
MNQLFKEIIQTIKKNDPSARCTMDIVLTNPGFWAIVYYRFSHFLYKNHLILLAKMVTMFSRFLTGVEIHPAAKIGKRLFIDHGMGLVIGETAIIGDDVKIFHGVTLGGTGKEHGKRHPNIENNVLLSAYSQVIGNITIGENSKIGANAVVLEDIPANCTAVGMPAKVVRYEGEKVEETEAEALMHGSHIAKEDPAHDQTV